MATEDKKITDPEVIEQIRNAMPEATPQDKGLMSSVFAEKIVLSRSIYLDPENSYEVDVINGIVLLYCLYITNAVSIYYVSSPAGIVRPLAGDAPSIIDVYDNKMRINNPYSVKILVVFSYLTI